MQTPAYALTPLTLRRSVPLLIHVLGWGLLGFFLLVLNPLVWRVTLPAEFWIRQSVLLAVFITLFYLNTEVLVPRLLLRDRVWPFILVQVGLIAAVMLLMKGVESALNLPELMDRAFHPNRPPGGRTPKPGNWRRSWFDTFLFMSAAMVLGISTSIAAVRKWQNDARARQALEQERTQSELSFLKAQINPHFFFNTLNNIYALTIIDVEAAREALHRLSRMMRYVLYETQAGTVRLGQEVDFLRDYIQLMQLRLTDKVRVVFDADNVAPDVPVAPMLLLPFLENAFKHGVSATRPSRIAITLHQQANRLTFEVRNTLFADTAAPLDESNGIGLTNTRRRLELLYPSRYTLLVEECTPDDEYYVRLDLQLSELPELSMA